MIDMPPIGQSPYPSCTALSFSSITHPTKSTFPGQSPAPFRQAISSLTGNSTSPRSRPIMSPSDLSVDLSETPPATATVQLVSLAQPFSENTPDKLATEAVQSRY